MMKKIMPFASLLLGLAFLGLGACTGPQALNAVTLNPDRSTEVSRNIAYGPHPRHRLDVYRPAGAGSHPVLVYVHGGGWEVGNKDEYAFVGKRFAAEGYLTVMINYRLTPDGAWPVFMQDVAKAVAYVHDNIAEMGGDPSRLFLSGHSAGAYNVVMLGVAPEFLAAEGKTLDIIDGVAGISGPYDFLPSPLTAVQAAFDSAPDPAATQPVNRVTANAPPMLLLHGLDDESVEKRNVTVMEAALKEKGIRVDVVYYEDTDHRETVIAIAWPRVAPVVDDIVAFFESVD